MIIFTDYREYNNKIRQYPIIVEKPDINDLSEIRKKIGLGYCSCKLLRQRTNSNQEAINLHYKIAMELSNRS